MRDIKSQKVIQKDHLEEKLSQKRSGKILHGGFLHSQLSPVRRKNARAGGLAMGKPLDPCYSLSGS
jgi:hypothetical protein